MFQPKFTISNNILNSISKIEASKEVIENSPLVPFWERKFREEAEARTVHYSVKIEDPNFELQFSQSKKLLEGKQIVGTSRRNIQEILNYREAMDYINKHFEKGKKKTIDERSVLMIHKILTKNLLDEKESGKYRKTQVATVSSKTLKVVHMAPKPNEVKKLMGELFLWYNTAESDNIHPVLKAGIFFHEFVWIHPFIEANGRAARTLATLSLYLDDYDIKKFFSLEEHYDSDLKRYYEHLKNADETRDLTKWLEYFSEVLMEELQKVKEKVVNISRDTKLKQKIGGNQIPLSDRQLLIYNYIEDHGSIQNQDWRNLLPDVSDDTVLRDLKKMMDAKLIKKVGKTKSARYILRK